MKRDLDQELSQWWLIMSPESPGAVAVLYFPSGVSVRVDLSACGRAYREANPPYPAGYSEVDHISRILIETRIAAEREYGIPIGPP